MPGSLLPPCIASPIRSVRTDGPSSVHRLRKPGWRKSLGEILIDRRNKGWHHEAPVGLSRSCSPLSYPVSSSPPRSRRRGRQQPYAPPKKPSSRPRECLLPCLDRGALPDPSLPCSSVTARR